MTTEQSSSQFRYPRLVQIAVIVLMAYWTAYAVVVPVTVWDSHTYNLARLLVAEHGGLFGNTAWNTDRQAAFPWSFDAVHYPFLWLGWGYALPSFACFVGLMVIVFRMSRARFDERTGWYCCLAMLALPTVVFQATSTKNDMAVVFGVGCWVYAMWRFRVERLRRFLFLGALGLGFAAGAKSSGLPLFMLLAAYTIWHLRSHRRMLAYFLGFSAISFLLWGSVEIYWNNQRTFGDLIGGPNIAIHKNADGFQGTVANFVRYGIGSTSIGVDMANHHGPFTARLETICRGTLDLMGLVDKGYRPDFNDSKIEFIKDGGEGGSDYGPLGTISLWLAVWILLRRPSQDILWRLCIAGLGSFVLTCATIAWMPWNLRFLMLPFLLFTLATTIRLIGPKAQSVVAQRAFLLVALSSAVLYPLCSFNRTPQDIWLSVTNRQEMALREHAAMNEVVDELRARREQIGHAPVILAAGANSWVLPILQMRDLKVIPDPHVDLPHIQQAAKQYHSDSVYILMLNRRPETDWNATLTKTFKEPDTSLLEWHPSPAKIPEQK